jgi:phosphoribosyl 1,2-cyclic phosphodiesterase
VDDGHTRLLLEAGIRIAELRKRAGFSLSGIEACLITHEHGDHACGVKDVMKAGIDCFMSAGTLKALNVTGHRLPLLLESKQQFKVGTWTILPFDTVHDAAEPLGFLLVNQAGEKLLFATDTAYISYRFKGLTHIALEANFAPSVLKENVAQGHVSPDVAKKLYGRHMSIDAVKKFLAANDLSRVQEIQLLHLSDQNSDAGKFQSEIETQTGKPVYIADSLNKGGFQ